MFIKNGDTHMLKGEGVRRLSHTHSLTQIRYETAPLLIEVQYGSKKTRTATESLVQMGEKAVESRVRDRIQIISISE